MFSVETPLILSVISVLVLFDSYFRLLEVDADNKLNFAYHIATVYSKLSKTAGMLYRVRNFVPIDVLLNLYYSHVYPYLIYGILTYGNTAEVHLHPLVIIQKRIARTITYSNVYESSAPIFKKLEISTMNLISSSL